MSDQDLRFSLSVVDATSVDRPVVLRVYVANWSDGDVAVNRRLALGRPESEADVSLEISGPDGKPRPFTARIRIGLATDDDFVTLMPFTGVGRDLVIDPGTYFDLSKPGRYEVRASWSNSPDTAPIEAEAIVISLSSDA